MDAAWLLVYNGSTKAIVITFMHIIHMDFKIEFLSFFSFHSELCEDIFFYKCKQTFISFQEIPPEIFEIIQLETLKLRNNPIKEIAPEIGALKHLRTLVMSFCLISTLPPQ